MKPEHITAWALNELPQEEQARLDAELRADPALRGTAESTREFCTIVTRELRDDTITLSPAQRARILAASAATQAGSAPSFAPRPLRWWQRPAIPMAAAAAVIVLGSIAAVSFQDESATQAETNMAGPRTETIKVAAASIPKHVGSSQPGRSSASSQLLKMEATAAPKDLLAGATAGRIAAQGMDQAAAMEGKPASAPLSIPQNNRMLINAGSMQLAQAPPELAAAASAASAVSVAGVPNIMSEAPKPGIYLPSPAPKPAEVWQPARQETPGSESYTPITENSLVSVAREPLSTFSIDVDTASYAHVRRFLNQNTRPPRDAVRIEELVNYFPTDEAGPAADSGHPFVVRTDMAACPWQPQHRLARIHLKGREVPAGSKPSNLVFLVDVSGSMEGPEKLELVQRSLRMLTEHLGESDRVSIVTYAGGTEVVLPSTNGMQKAQIIAATAQLRSGGGTAGAAGITLAYEQAVKGFLEGGVNRVILCTDGDFNVGISSPKELESFITEKARSGVFLSVLGFGTGNLKDHTMETLADKGNGNYAYIDSISEARKVLVEQMQGTLVTIAKDVKVQIEFNPAVIREYRLIGYENRLLAKEDFNDDTKDAGEIGAGHSVTALYELVPASLPPGTQPRPMVDKLKYQPAETPLAAAAPPVKTLGGVPADEALTVKLRYKEPAGNVSKLLEAPVKDDARPLEKADPEFQFSAAVAGFGMLLRGSSYAGQLTWNQVRQLARAGKGADPLGYRGEFLQLIEKAAAQ